MVLRTVRADRDTDPDVADIGSEEYAAGDMQYWKDATDRFTRFQTQTFGRSLLNGASASAVRTLLELGTASTVTLGTGVATALAVNVGSAGAPVVNGGALGTPSSGVLTNATGLPVATGISGLGTGIAALLALDEAAFIDAVSSSGLVTAATYADLIALSPGDFANNDVVLLLGRSAAGDRAGGFFRRATGDQSATVVSSTKSVSAVDTAADTLTSTAHGLVSGQGVIATAADAGLSLNTVYYVARVDANTVSLHTTIVAALAGTGKVNITALAGSLSLKVLVDPKQAVYVIATGDDLDGSDGVWIRDYAGEKYATWWGLNTLGVSEDGNTEALNGFAQFIREVGGHGKLPSGQMITTSKVSFNFSQISTDGNPRRLLITGEGQGSTQILSQHSGRCIEIQGNNSNGIIAYGALRDFALRGSGILNSIGLWIDDAGSLDVDLTIMDFYRGVEATDWLSSVCSGNIRFNYYAGRVQFSDYSRPNNLSFPDLITGANYYGGWEFVDAASIIFSGAYSVEGNAIDPDGNPYAGGYGIKMTGGGLEGAGGLSLGPEGYFELNGGDADIVITHSSGSVKHNIAAGFLRFHATRFATNHIKLTISGGSCKLDCSSSFENQSPYTASKDRKVIDAPSGSVIDSGCVFFDETEKPDTSIFVGSVTDDVNYRYMRFEDDFVGDGWSTHNYSDVVGTDPQCSIAVSQSLRGGIIVLTTGNDAAASMAVNGVELNMGALQWRVDQGGFEAVFRFYIDNITTTTWFFGMTDTYAREMPFTYSGTTLTSNASDAFGVLFDTDATTDNWKLVGVANNVDATVQDAGAAPVNNTFEYWRITCDASGNARFYRNGAQVGTVMTGAVTPSVLLTPVVAGFSRAAASRIFALDAWRFKLLK